jgi:hypothetical protein
MQQLARELAAQTHEVEREALLAHAKRGGLLLVIGGTDLISAAVAVATNRTHIVAHWLSSGVLVRATVADLEAAAAAARYRFVIVQPYVIALPLRD